MNNSSIRKKSAIEERVSNSVMITPRAQKRFYSGHVTTDPFMTPFVKYRRWRAREEDGANGYEFQPSGSLLAIEK